MTAEERFNHARENCNCHVFHDPPCAACTIATIAEAEAAARADERERYAKRLEESAAALELAQSYFDPPVWKRIAEALRGLANCSRREPKP